MKYSIYTILAIGLFMLGLSMLSPAKTPSQAQGIRATPTFDLDETNERTSDDDDDDSETVNVSSGGISGFVYDYSTGAHVGGLTVILDGGSWRTQTQTDSNGFYQFAGLGEGKAILSLGLPAGATSVTPNWPINTGTRSQNVNLGYYSGAVSNVPVLLSVGPDQVVAAAANQDDRFTITVQNQSGGQASGAKVNFTFPESVTLIGAETSLGRLTFLDQQLIGILGNLSSGQTARIQIRVAIDPALVPQTVIGQVIFNYQEQLTPQLTPIYFVTSQRGQASAVRSARQSTASEHLASEKASPRSATRQDKEASASQPASLIPTTGDTAMPSNAAFLGILLSLFIMIALSFGGYQAFMKQRRADTSK